MVAGWQTGCPRVLVDLVEPLWSHPDGDSNDNEGERPCSNHCNQAGCGAHGSSSYVAGAARANAGLLHRLWTQGAEMSTGLDHADYGPRAESEQSTGTLTLAPATFSYQRRSGNPSLAQRSNQSTNRSRDRVHAVAPGCVVGGVHFGPCVTSDRQLLDRNSLDGAGLRTPPRQTAHPVGCPGLTGGSCAPASSRPAAA